MQEFHHQINNCDDWEMEQLKEPLQHKINSPGVMNKLDDELSVEMATILEYLIKSEMPRITRNCVRGCENDDCNRSTFNMPRLGRVRIFEAA